MSPKDFLCRVPAEVVAEYSEWQECVAFRFVKLDEDTVEIQVTRDLELLTRPDEVGPGSEFRGHEL